MVFADCVCIEFHDTGAPCHAIPRSVWEGTLCQKFDLLSKNESPELTERPKSSALRIGISDKEHLQSEIKAVLGGRYERFRWRHSVQWQRKFAESLWSEFGLKHIS